MYKDKSVWLKYITIGTALIIIYKITDNFGGIIKYLNLILDALFPVIIGAVIAFFLVKPTKKLEALLKKIKFVNKFAKLISILLVYAIIIAALAIGIKFLLPVLISNAEELISNIPRYYNSANNYISNSEFLKKAGIIEQIMDKARNILTFSNLNKYISYVSSIASSFLTFFLSIIISIYILLEKDGIFSFLSSVKNKFFHGERINTFVAYVRKIVDMFYSYFIGLAFDALLISIISSVAFTLFKIPYAPLLGLVIGIGNLVPFFGPIVSAVIVFIVSAITLGPIQAIWVIAFQFALGQIDGNLIQPKILSNSTGISPLTVLVSVIVFGELFGFLGMLLGVPIGASIKILVDDFMDDGKINAS